MDMNREVDMSQYSDKDMPRYPARVLAAHLTAKGMQLGACLGSAVIPVYALIRKRPMGEVARVAFPLTVGLGATFAYGKAYKMYAEGKLDEAGVDDRAYRITKNAGQVKVDKYSFIGGLAGATTAVFTAKGRPGTTLAYACVGITLGVIAQVLDDHVINKKTSA